MRCVNEWGLSSVGRAIALHAIGQRFEPASLHHYIKRYKYKFVPGRLHSRVSAQRAAKSPGCRSLHRCGSFPIPGRPGARGAHIDNCIESGEYTIHRNLKWSSYKGRTADALGQKADEGRGQRRNASGSCKQASIRRFPNGVTRSE